MIHHEFIGLNVHARSKKNDALDLKGTIIDETKNTIKIEGTDKCERIIPKNGTIFVFEIPDGEKIEVDGNILSIRPEDRIKKRYKKI